MQLDEILKKMVRFQESHPYEIFSGEDAPSYDSVTIEGVTSDSRNIQKNNIFGVFSTDFNEAEAHVQSAYDKGSRVFLIATSFSEHFKKKELYKDSIWITCQKPRQIFAKLTSKYYGSHPQYCVAVTGTSGKTSVCSMVLQLWRHLGISSASIGTLGVSSSDKQKEPLTTGLTTPDSVAMHRTLAELKKEGVDHVIMEASSHGLDQYRLDGLRFKVAAFTNLSHDHLDYHKSMEGYFSAKKRLFEDLISKKGSAVLNADIDEYDDLVDICILRNYQLYSYGKAGAFVRLKSVQQLGKIQRLTLIIKEREYTVDFPLIGSTQIQNLLCALTIVLSMRAHVESTLRAVELLEPIIGRLNYVAPHPRGASIYVDYAHKPDALERVLKDIRGYCRGQLHLVFGCGGNRDQEKRALMGKVAHQLADKIYITDDNPRFEEPSSIREQVLKHCPGAINIEGRYNAIETALSYLEKGDTLLIAGKGHETTQIIKDKKLPFSDIEVVKEILKKFKKEKKYVLVGSTH